MKKITFALFLSVLSLQGWSQRTDTKVRDSFSFYSFRNFYSCYLVEQRVRNIFWALELENFNVQCSGGIDRGGSGSIYLSYGFTNPEREEGSRLDLDHNDFLDNSFFGSACDFSTRFLRQLGRNIPHKNYRVTGFCGFNDSQGRYGVEIDF
jgi:hypothetical protein